MTANLAFAAAQNERPFEKRLCNIRCDGNIESLYSWLNSDALDAKVIATADAVH